MTLACHCQRVPCLSRRGATFITRSQVSSSIPIRYSFLSPRGDYCVNDCLFSFHLDRTSFPRLVSLYASQACFGHPRLMKCTSKYATYCAVLCVALSTRNQPPKQRHLRLPQINLTYNLDSNWSLQLHHGQSMTKRYTSVGKMANLWKSHVRFNYIRRMRCSSTHWSAPRWLISVDFRRYSLWLATRRCSEMRSFIRQPFSIL